MKLLHELSWTKTFLQFPNSYHRSKRVQNGGHVEFIFHSWTPLLRIREGKENKGLIDVSIYYCEQQLFMLPLLPRLVA
jgi:hypothetical protein